MAARPSPGAAAPPAAAAGADELEFALEGERGELLGNLRAPTLRTGHPAPAGGDSLLEGMRTLTTDEFVNGHPVSPPLSRPPRATPQSCYSPPRWT